MSSTRIEAALARAAEAVAQGPHSAPPDGTPRTLRVVIGDPQAPLAHVLEVLDAQGLLGPEGWLRPEVQLVAVGDYFDWGPREAREEAATSATHLLAWLAAHPADQVVMLVGNHDLGRVGELARFSDATFRAARDEADRAYVGGHTDEAMERDVLARWPEVPSAELVARDFSTFRAEQRDWVAHLLRARRLRAAHAAQADLLVLHAGVTREDLNAAGLPEARHADAFAVAEALNRALDRAMDAWTGEPLVVPGLHHPGNAREGEGRGIFYQRPSVLPEDEARARETPRRRYDPRRLPLGLTQVVGHTRDKRSRQLLGLSGGTPRDGVIRHLVTDGQRVDYAYGAPPSGRGEAVLVFTDGAMREVPAEGFELFDLGTRAPRRAG
ncbi:metallophosphoesterase [Myxococcaceae bacterium GXIMD 01537]